MKDSPSPENDPGDSLLQTFLGTFCRPCTAEDRPRDESFGQMLSWWRRWIALQLPGTTHRAYNRVWLRTAIPRAGYRLIQNGQGTRVKGLRLRTAKPLSSIPLLPLVTASYDPTLPGDQWLRLRAQASSTHPDDVATWPVQWRYDSVRYAPPDTVLWRAFTNECLVRGSNGTADEGDGQMLLHEQRTRWDVFAATFAQWLVRKGASHVLRQQHSREWLRTWLEESCGKKIRVRSGTRYVLGYALRDGVAAPIRDYALPTHLHPGRQIQQVRRGSFAASRYWKQREREARRAAGMPVDDSLYAISPVPGEDTAVAGTNDAHWATSPARADTLDALSNGFLASPTSAARQAVLLPLARQYLSETVCADPAATVSLHDLKRGFAFWLLNQSRSDGGSDLALRAALHEWGVRPPEGKKKRLRVVHGYRYRTPDDVPVSV